MRSTADKFIDFLVLRSRVNAWCTIALVAAFSLFAFRIEFENSVESLLSESDPEIIFYQQFKREFGEDQVLVIAIPMGDIFTKTNITTLDKISKAIGILPDIRKVRSLTTAQDIVGVKGSFEVIHFMDKFQRDPNNLNALKKEALANPIYKTDLFSDNGKIASILIEAHKGTNRDRYKNIVNSVNSIMAQMQVKEYYFAGNPIVELQMTNDMWHDLKTFVPLTYLLLFGLLYLFFRNVQIPLLALFVVTLSSGFLLGLMGALGITMNGITVGLPSLLMCIAVLSSMHLLTAYRLALGQRQMHSLAIRDALTRILKPCFLTTLTTAAGFACVSMTEVVPLRQFGLVGASSTIAAYLICLFVMPHLLSLIPAKIMQITERESKWLRLVFAALSPIYRHRLILVFGAVTLLSFALYEIPKLKVETLFLNFMNEDSNIKKATNYIQNNLGGVASLEIVITSPFEEGILEPQVLAKIQNFQIFLNQIPEVDKTVSVVEFVKKMNQAVNNGDPAAYVIPSTFDQIAQYIFTYSLSGRNNDLDDFVDYNYKTARIRGRLSQSSSVALQATLKKIQDYIDTHFDSTLHVKVTSYSVIQASMMDKLIIGQLSGLGLALLIMFAAFFLVSRSVVVATLSLVPHILPLLGSACLMGIMGISVNVGTAVIASITFGLVVDDSIHFLSNARQAALQGKSPQNIVDTAFAEVGPTILYSSLILTFGFSLLMLGNSYFTFSFGLLCAFSTIAAMTCNTLFLPYFVCHLKSFQDFGRSVTRLNVVAKDQLN